MKNGRKRIIVTILCMAFIGVLIVIACVYWINRTQTLVASKAKPTEVEKMADKDLELYYPETPTQLAKLFAGMMKTMYNHPADKNIKALALKIRELYDSEFLQNNNEETYLQDLNENLAKWKKNKLKITNYSITEQDKNLDKEIDGIQYANRYIRFTMQKNTKYTETWNVLMRQDDGGRWKILGWKVAS